MLAEARIQQASVAVPVALLKAVDELVPNHLHLRFASETSNPKPLACESLGLETSPGDGALGACRVRLEGLGLNGFERTERRSSWVL